MLTDQKVSFDSLLLAGILDRLSILAWFKTKDGQSGRNRPVSLTEKLTTVARERRELVFDSGEDFEECRRKLLRKYGGET